MLENIQSDSAGDTEAAAPGDGGLSMGMVETKQRTRFQEGPSLSRAAEENEHQTFSRP